MEPSVPAGVSSALGRIAEIQNRFGIHEDLPIIRVNSGSSLDIAPAVLDNLTQPHSRSRTDLPSAAGAGANGLLSMPAGAAGLFGTPPAGRYKSGVVGANTLRWASLAEKAGAATGLDPKLILAVIEQESGGDSQIKSRAGATGLMQLMPGTARGLGVDPNDAEQNVMGGARYLRAQIDRFGSLGLGLAAYNAGPDAVAAYSNTIPPFAETQSYVANIEGMYASLKH